MTTIFKLGDYRDLLLEFYQNRKEDNPLYSYRMMAARINLDSSQLYRVLHKKQHLPLNCIPRVKDLLSLKGREAECFDLLVAAARCRNESKKAELLKQAESLQDVKRQVLDSQQLQFLGQWHNAAIRAWLEVNGGVADPRNIAAQMEPALSAEEVSDALQLLLDLGLVKKISSQRLALAETHLTVSGPEKAEAVREFQRQVMQLGARSLAEIPKEERDISTLTLAVDDDCFEDLCQMMKEFRRRVQKRIESVHSPNRIMQLNMAYFPVTKKKENRE